MDDDTGEFPMPVLVPRDELEKLALLIMKSEATIEGALSYRVGDEDRKRALSAWMYIAAYARRWMFLSSGLPAVDSVDRE